MVFHLDGVVCEDVVVDPSVSRSATSLSFPGSVVVSEHDGYGTVLHAQMTLLLDPELAPDLVLGQDWLQAVAVHRQLAADALWAKDSDSGSLSSCVPNGLSGSDDFVLSTDNIPPPLCPLDSVPRQTSVFCASGSGAPVRVDESIYRELEGFGVPRNIGIIVDNLTRSRGVAAGGRMSAFTSDRSVLLKLSSMHGIQTTPTRDTEQCQIDLLTHLLTGQCVRGASRIAKGKDRADCDASLCRQISLGFTEPKELSDLVLDYIISDQQSTVRKIQSPRLVLIANSLPFGSPVVLTTTLSNQYKAAVRKIQRYRKHCDSLGEDERDMSVPFSAKFESMKQAELVAYAAAHRIKMEGRLSSEQLRGLIFEHLVGGACMKNVNPSDLRPFSCACDSAVSDFLANSGLGDDPSCFPLHLMSTQVDKIKLRPLRRLLHHLCISFEPSDTFSHLRRVLKDHIRKAIKGKARKRDAISLDFADIRASQETRQKWPELIDDSTKDSILEHFMKLTSHSELVKRPCACCSESVRAKDVTLVDYRDVPTRFFLRPDVREDDDTPVDDRWLDSAVAAPPLPFIEGPLRNMLLDPAAVFPHAEGINLALCKPCLSALRREELPKYALANRTYMGAVPNELKGLSTVEESMIALCRSKCYVVRLKEQGEMGKEKQNRERFEQHGYIGNIIVYPQRPGLIARRLPPSIEDITSPMCVLFVGSKPPTQEWLQKHAQPLTARGYKVRKALRWLKKNNRLYKDIEINEEVLDQLDKNPVLPFHVEHVETSAEIEGRTDRYDNMEPLYQMTGNGDIDDKIFFDKVVMTEVEGDLNSDERSSAIFRHLHVNKKGALRIFHDPQPVNEFNNPSMFPMMYPTLFPYGIGGLEDKTREVPISLKGHAKHLFSLADGRFQEHDSFLFAVFNILQRREMLLRTHLRVKRSAYERVADGFCSVTPEAVHAVTERVARGDYTTVTSDQERQVLNLMKEVKAVSRTIPGSPASKTEMRNEVRALMIDQGMPSFFVTINPSDVYNPMVRLLSGEQIDLDTIDRFMFKYEAQARKVSKNPFVAAEFFHLFMKAFIRAVLGFDADTRPGHSGILGRVKAYYGAVEAQGRGSLHCHFLIWLEGGMSPSDIREKIIERNDVEFRDRLLAFLDDTISNRVPEDPCPESAPYHPSCIRVPMSHPSASASEKEKMKTKDDYLLMEKLQRHDHRQTCYKYDSQSCRFNLDPSNYQEKSYVDPETGEVCLRCLDGMVNNFNETMLKAIRCNMDIKFIGSGAAAKAVLYYMTDYITKHQMKAHVAYAALEDAVNRLAASDVGHDEIAVRAKQLLRRCVYSMISRQELSGQQVAAYLMDYGDHVTSHKFSPFMWGTAESYVDALKPSPECYPSLRHGSEADKTAHLPLTSEVPGQCGGDDGDSESEAEEAGFEADELENTKEPTLLKDDENEDIILDISGLNSGKPLASRMNDYVARGSLLGDVCLWDYLGRVRKVSKSTELNARSRRRTLKDLSNGFDDETIGGDEEEDYCGDEGAPSDKEDDAWYTEYLRLSDDPLLADRHLPKNRFLASSQRTRPRLDYHQNHPDRHSHHQYVVANKLRSVVVPVGPSLPRRDRQEQKEKYGRLMLMFFKPWTCLEDLLTCETWSASFEQFVSSCDHRIRFVLDNIQQQHECKDARDDHFAEKKRERARRKFTLASERLAISADDFAGDNRTDEDIMRHLESIERSYAKTDLETKVDVVDCVVHAEECGMFTVDNQAVPSEDSVSEMENKLLDSYTLLCGSRDNELENLWVREYKRRAEQRKIEAAKVHAVVSDQNEPVLDVVDDGSGFRGLVDERQEGVVQEPSVFVPAEDSSGNCVSVENTVEKWQLNEKQALAFSIIADHAQQPKTDPLRMILSGAGGTGKSQVIAAVTDFFVERKERRRFVLASFTGVAARNVQGATLHSALQINQIKRKKSQNARAALRNAWRGVDYLIVDEYSMISCQFMYTISEALTIAKENQEPFGGVSVIFAGDFAQLPPVSSTRLSTKLMKTAKNKGELGDHVIIGRLLWLSLRTCVILTDVMRQNSLQDKGVFVSLLSRLREGRCTDADYRLLQTRLALNVGPDWTSEEWRQAPVIVRSNAAKDKLNELSTVAFARRVGRPVHWYYATDRHQGETFETDKLRNYLCKLSSGKTNSRLGRIPLVIGMPVMITANFDVEGGIVNGCMGTLQKIRYWKDSQGRRHATSCVVELDQMTSDPLPTLTSRQAACIEDTVDLVFENKFEDKRLKVRRTQLPLTPGFAMTTHKSQGLTLSHVIVDLESCSGVESPYVMLSRVKSLSGLLILRPFRQSKITCHCSEDVRSEFKRQELLDLVTVARHGSVDRAAVALAELKGHGLHQLAVAQAKPLSATDCNYANLLRYQDADLQAINALLASPRPKKRSADGDDWPGLAKKRRTFSQLSPTT